MKELKTKNNKKSSLNNGQGHSPHNNNSNNDSQKHTSPTPTPHPTTKPKKNIIDDIFATTKQEANKTTEQTEEQKQEKQKLKKEKKIQKKLKEEWRIEEKLRKINDGQIPTIQQQTGGLKVYSEKELNIGKGGNTKLCPIDCDCCF